MVDKKINLNSWIVEISNKEKDIKAKSSDKSFAFIKDNFLNF